MGTKKKNNEDIEYLEKQIKIEREMRALSDYIQRIKDRRDIIKLTEAEYSEFMWKTLFFTMSAFLGAVLFYQLIN